MKIKGHQSFYIRRGWIHKGIKKILDNPYIFNDKSIVLTDEFGIGSNMVTALKYWMNTLGLMEKIKSGNEYRSELSQLGYLIWSKDPYLEKIETWELLHYKLVINEEMATTWNWFFNHYNGIKFSKENLIKNLTVYINKIYQKEIAERSIKDDITCLINTYIDREITIPDENIESPFTQLGLIKTIGKQNGETIYQKRAIKELNVYLAYYILKETFKNTKSINLKDVINGENSIGRIYNLDSYKIMSTLENMKNKGLINIIRTGGLDYINLNEEVDEFKLLEKIYS